VLATPFAGSTVVVTHHAVALQSADPKYHRDHLTAAFASDLSDLIAAAQPALWVHGHVHNSADYQIGKTRILSNPHGYCTENPPFNPALVVEVGSLRRGPRAPGLRQTERIDRTGADLPHDTEASQVRRGVVTNGTHADIGTVRHPLHCLSVVAERCCRDPSRHLLPPSRCSCRAAGSGR
jgi:hypothetical protein